MDGDFLFCAQKRNRKGEFVLGESVAGWGWKPPAGTEREYMARRITGALRRSPAVQDAALVDCFLVGFSPSRCVLRMKRFIGNKNKARG